MRVALIILIVINALASFVIAVASTSAIHQILATVTFLVAAVLLGAHAVMGAVDKMRNELGQELRVLRQMAEGASSGETPMKPKGSVHWKV